MLGFFHRRPPTPPEGMVGNPVSIDPAAPAFVHAAAIRLETIRRYLEERGQPGMKPFPEGRLDELAAEIARLKATIAAAGIKVE